MGRSLDPNPHPTTGAPKPWLGDRPYGKARGSSLRAGSNENAKPRRACGLARRGRYAPAVKATLSRATHALMLPRDSGRSANELGRQAEWCRPTVRYRAEPTLVVRFRT